jgi:hypothetical protein
MESACTILCGASHSWCDRLSDRFGNGSLDWLVGFTRETNPHLAELRRFGDIGVVRLLDESPSITSSGWRASGTARRAVRLLSFCAGFPVLRRELRRGANVFRNTIQAGA